MAVVCGGLLGYATTHPDDVVVVVGGPMPDRLNRVETRRGVAREDALARIELQAADEERRSVAQFVIANGGDLAALAVAVDELWNDLQRLLMSKGG